MRRFLVAAGTMAVLGVAAAPASAVPILFNGGSFDVSVSSLGGNTYQFTYTADFTNWDDDGSTAGIQSDADWIYGLNFGLSGKSDITALSLTGVSANLDINDWDVSQHVLNSNGCNVNPTNFEICVQDNDVISPFSAPTDTNQIYFWTVSATYATAASTEKLTGTNPIRALFVDANGLDQGDPLMSESTTFSTTGTVTTTGTPTTTNGTVPEPASMFLLGAGLLLAGRRFRRRTF